MVSGSVQLTRRGAAVVGMYGVDEVDVDELVVEVDIGGVSVDILVVEVDIGGVSVDILVVEVYVAELVVGKLVVGSTFPPKKES